jgi:hypothetical protein
VSRYRPMVSSCNIARIFGMAQELFWGCAARSILPSALMRTSRTELLHKSGCGDRSFDLRDFLERPHPHHKPRNGEPRHPPASNGRDHHCYLEFPAALPSAASTYSKDLSHSHARCLTTIYPRFIRSALYSLAHRYN